MWLVGILRADASGARILGFIEIRKNESKYNFRMRPNPEEEDVWAEILNDVSTASLNKDKKTLVFLGDEGCGECATGIGHHFTHFQSPQS